MRTKRLLLPISFAIACLAASPLAYAATSSDQTNTNAGKHDTAKGAAAGALVGHEMGSGHALAGAGVGAAIGHHEKKKAQEKAGNNNG